MKRQAREWRKAFATHTQDREFASRVNKELLNSNERYKDQFTKRLVGVGADLNRNFTNEEIQGADKYMKSCSTSLLIR